MNNTGRAKDSAASEFRLSKALLMRYLAKRIAFALRSRIRRPNSDFRRAQALIRNWKLEDALVLAEKLPLRERLRLQSEIFLFQGKHQEAAAACTHLLKLAPLSSEVRLRARSHGLTTHPVDATTALRLIRSNLADGWYLAEITRTLFENGEVERTLAAGYEALKALCRRPVNQENLAAIATTVTMAGMCFESTNRWEDAIDYYNHVRLLSRTASEAGLVRCHFELGNFATAWCHLPEKAKNHTVYSAGAFDVLQGQGKMREAYLGYRARPVSKALSQQFAQPDPSATSFNSDTNRGKSAFIVMEGGPGDEARFSTLYPDIMELFSSVSISCDPRLFDALVGTYPEIAFVPVSRQRKEVVKGVISDRSTITHRLLYDCLSDDAAAVARNCDVVCSILDLIADLRTTKESFKSAKRRALRAKLHPLIETGFTSIDRVNIGLSWRSLLQGSYRDKHYFPVTTLEQLSGLDATFWILQAGVTDEEIRFLEKFVEVRLPGFDLVQDLSAQISLSSYLDLIISPFSTAGEIGGAVGTPTLLAAFCQSTLARRHPQSDQDIWHPSARIISGKPAFDKVAGTAEIVRTLEAILASRNSTRSRRSHRGQHHTE